MNVRQLLDEMYADGTACILESGGDVIVHPHSAWAILEGLWCDEEILNRKVLWFDVSIVDGMGCLDIYTLEP